MRKFLIFLIILFICGCNNTKSKSINNASIEEENIINEDVSNVEEIIENNPIKLALYVNKNKIDNYSSNMTKFTDIVSLECYYTDDNNIMDGSFKEVFNNYYNNYQNIDKYKIGYRIKFNTIDGEFDKYIYRPSDVASFFNYIQVYLYDDVHQDSSWYSHVEDTDYNDNTLLTSIKLTASVYIDRVNSDIEVMVFSYSDKDVNENGEYIGNNKYSITISKG